MAGDLNRAKCLCSEPWFVTELASYRSRGLPIWNGTAELRLRRANSVETAEVQIASASERVRGEYEAHVLAFLLPVDAACQ
jgi:hypothetical protein